MSLNASGFSTHSSSSTDPATNPQPTSAATPSATSTSASNAPQTDSSNTTTADPNAGGGGKGGGAAPSADVAQTSPQIGTLTKGPKSKFDMRYGSHMLAGGAPGARSVTSTIYCASERDNDNIITVSGGVASFDIWLAQTALLHATRSKAREPNAVALNQLLKAPPSTVHVNVKINDDGSVDQIVPLAPEHIDYLKKRAALAATVTQIDPTLQSEYAASANIKALHIKATFAATPGAHHEIVDVYDADKADQGCERTSWGEDYQGGPAVSFCKNEGSPCQSSSDCCDGMTCSSDNHCL